MSPASPVALCDLLRRQQPGMTLEQPFYTDPEIFEEDLDRIVARQWLYVDHVSAVPQPGDVLTYEIAGESIILVRGRDREVRAFFNVCRHRGSRIIKKACDHVRTLTCPYHAWTWDLEGRLVRARSMADDFRPEDWPLHACRTRIYQGLVFICLAEEDDEAVIEFDSLARRLDPYIENHCLDAAKVAARKAYPTAGNWKLAVENFRECYHCAPAHPGYTSVNAYVLDGERDQQARSETVAAWAATWEARGVVTRSTGLWGDSFDELQPHAAMRQPIREGYRTLSRDGHPVAPLMGRLTEWDGGETLMVFGPLFYVYLAGDHAALFRFTPVHATHTHVEVTWLVNGDAREGEDYDEERLTWMWDVTTIEDTRIIGDNQLGVNSRRYRPGRYSTKERATTNFVEWYKRRMGDQP